MTKTKKIIVVKGKYRIRIAIVGIVVGLMIGWFLPFWTQYAIHTKGIDGRIQQCLIENDE